MIRDDLDVLLEDAFPSCPACGERLDDAGDDDTRPALVCPRCGLGVIPPA